MLSRVLCQLRAVPTVPSAVRSFSSTVSAQFAAADSDVLEVPVPAPGQPGRLFTWGSGAGGQLGLGATTEAPVPMEVPETLSASGEPVQWAQVACGAGVTLAVSTAGELYSFGKCGYFSLGHGESVQEVNVPTRVEALDGIPIAAVAAGEYHCAAVSVEGDVFTWGWGGGFMYGCGGLGHGDTTSQPRPALVEWFGDQDVHIKAVACGERHTLALSNSGLVFSFGNGEFGRCGNGKRSQKLPEVVDVLEGTPCTRIAAGSAFSLALSEDNDLYVWGRNDQAQLGLGASVTMDPNTMEEYPLVLDTLAGRVADFAAGKAHTLASTTDGEVYYWGSRNFIEPKLVAPLLDVDAAPRELAAGAKTSGVVLDDGSLWTWGGGMMSAATGHGTKGTFKQPQQVQLFQRVKIDHIAMGDSHCAAITAD